MSPDAAMPTPTPPAGTVAVRVGLPWHLRRDAAALVWAAFGRQIAPGLDRRAGVARIRRGLQRGRIIVATDPDGRLIGLTGLRGPGGGIVASGPVRRRDVARLVGAIAAPFAGRTDDLVLDCLVVAPLWRGRGIAAALIDAALAEAARRGHPGVRAEVARGNAAALRAYGRAGLTCTGTTTGAPGWWPGRRTLRRAVG